VTLQRLLHVLDSFSEASGKLLAWLVLGVVVLEFAVVVLRYGFDFGSIAMQETVVYLHALLFLLAAAYTLKHDEHVRVDIFYRRRSIRGRALTDLLGSILLLLPVCGFIAWTSWDYVLQSWAMFEGSRESGGLDFVYGLKTALIVAPAFLILQGVAEICRNLLILSGKIIPTHHDDEAVL